MTAAVNNPSVTRKERGRQTRNRILQTAYDLFTERGYTATTMNDVASRAGVAMQTIYFAFHSKPELLGACVAWSVLDDDTSTPTETPWLESLTATDDLDTALRMLVEKAETALARSAPLDPVVRAAAHDPDLAAIQIEGEAQRRDGYGKIIRALHARFALRNGVDETLATDILMMLLGPQTWIYLIRDTGWSRAQWRTWIELVVAEQVFDRSR